MLDSTDFQNLILHIGLSQELDLEESLGQVVFRTKLEQGWLPKAENKKHLRWLRIELSKGWIPSTDWWLKSLSTLPSN